MNRKTIALAGNPNVGKSTLFNALTGMRQHTGNWSGKTVDHAAGQMKYKDMVFQFIDLPGAYSLHSESPDEKAAGDYIVSGKFDIILMVADATCLERNLLLICDILAITNNAVLCVNLMDEAKKKGICPDIEKLSQLLGIPVIATAARSKKGLPELLDTIYEFTPQQSAGKDSQDEAASGNIRALPDLEDIYTQCVTHDHENPHELDRKIDKIVTSKRFGFPIMILMLLLIFWLTMVGANYPSSALSAMFGILDEKLRLLMTNVALPDTLVSVLMDGLYTTLTWVISVMLPPMAIFFPLFTLLEDFGYLPRVAFNLDHAFKSCGAHGKQALTMCMVDIRMRGSR